MKARKNPPKESCKKCHVSGALKISAEPGSMPAYWNMVKPEEKSAAAAELLKGRADKADYVYSVEDDPEKVVIKSLQAAGERIRRERHDYKGSSPVNGRSRSCKNVFFRMAKEPFETG